MASILRKSGPAGMIVLLAVAAAASAQTVTVRTNDPAELSQLRIAAVGFIEKGQWASAGASIDKLLAQHPDDAAGLELRRILAEYERMADLRQGQRRQAYEESARKVATSIAKQAWEEALNEAVRTADLADSKEELAQQPWFNALVAKSNEQAQADRDKGEWLKATTIYSQLAALHSDDKEYKALAKRVARFARLEANFQKKDEAEKQLARIDEGMMADALHQINKFYVTEPDYRKMTLGGLDCLAAMTEVPSLAKAFEQLADKDKTARFRRQIKDLHDREQARESINLQGLAAAFLAAKEINAATLQLPEGLLIREFFDGALDQLDTFSSMIWPVDKGEFEAAIEGEFSGVGIQISIENSELTVISPLEDTPAYRAGILAGDVIVAIDGETTEKITIDQARQRIQGQAGTTVILTVRRVGLDKPRDFQLVRDRIRVATVKGYSRDADERWNYLIDKDARIGYVRITNYMRRTVEELENAMDEMAAQNVRAVIIDLRFNPGGLLTQAVEMSDLFVESGVLVSTEGRAMRPSKEMAHVGGTNKTTPIVVLVNGYSASAAEIVSGALKDHGRAIIVGDRSFGKGSVQNVIPVGMGGVADPKQAPAFLKLTTAYYYLPSGRSLHRRDDSTTWGVEPTVKVEVTRDELSDILDLRRDSDVIHRNGNGPTTQPETTTQPAREKIDPQLRTAVLVLKAELLKRRM